MKYKNIAIIAAKDNEEAVSKKDLLVKKYNFTDLTSNHSNLQNIDLVVAIGGDGLMLHLLHDFENHIVPIYGINCGTVGFLMNSFNQDNFLSAIEAAKESLIYPLRVTAIDENDKKHNYIAINEAYLLRQTSQIAKIKIEIGGHIRIKNLMADGVLVATAAGSTAYNLSVGGPIIPFGSDILAITPISPFRPRRWRGALLASNSKIRFEILDYKTRPTSAVADYNEIRNVKEVIVEEDRSICFKILFDPHHSLEERIISEQFAN